MAEVSVFGGQMSTIVNALANDTGEGISITSVSPPANVNVTIIDGSALQVDNIADNSISFSIRLPIRMEEMPREQFRLTYPMPKPQLLPVHPTNHSPAAATPGQTLPERPLPLIFVLAMKWIFPFRMMLLALRVAATQACFCAFLLPLTLREIVANARKSLP
ncbi:MAG: hypothetical protein R2788_24120 [Saprospiraceae bacterium]